MKRKIYISVILVVLACAAIAQPGYKNIALTYYQNNDLMNAAKAIDSAIVDERENTDPYTWHIRGFVYKDIYKKTDRDRDSKSRVIALESFFKSIELDEKKEFTKNNAKSIRFLGIQYYNDAVMTLDTAHYKLAIESYDLFRSTMQRLDSNYNFTDKNIQFYNVLAGSYNKIFVSDKKGKRPFFKKAITAYRVVLALDSTNYRANYNLGILYHNEGVDLIINLDPRTPLDTLIALQERTVELFKKALPYMLIAHEKNPKKKETILGLAGIYFNLNEKEKSDFYNTLLEQIENKQDEDEENKK